jgi:hypothetical protein
VRRNTFARRLRHAVFDESRAGRAAEVAAWANAASAVGVGVGVAALTWGRLSGNAVWIGVVVAVVTFAGLRLSLAHRITMWISAVVGTLSVAAIGGTIAWVFGHVIESGAAPSIAGVLGAVVSASLPAWSYAHIARRRANDVPDSLLEPVSVPHSR